MLAISVTNKSKTVVISAMAGPFGPKARMSPYTIEPGTPAKFDNMPGKAGVELTAKEAFSVEVTNCSDDGENGAEGPTSMFKLDGKDAGRITQNAVAKLDIPAGSKLWVGNLV